MKKDIDNFENDNNGNERDNNQSRGNKKMSNERPKKTSLKDSFNDRDFSPQHSGVNLGSVKEYDEPELLVTNLSYQAISDFLLENIQEIKPEKVNWERFDIESLASQIQVDSEAAIDTICKISGANYRDGRFTDFFDAIPILVFKKLDVVEKLSVDEDLGALSREEYEIDFSKIKQKNRRFFPSHGMVASVDKVNELVSVNVNIISVIVSALGYDPARFGRPSERNKLFLYTKQQPQSRNFKIAIANNKFLDDRLFDLLQRI
jgi:tRNA-binding EMAP/Myf-like protein